MTTALILAGHGSHISPETAGLVWQHVDALRALHVAGEITAAFWKEMPSFHTVLDSLAADDITIVPLFTAQGYFTQTVIPAEMGLTGALTYRAGRTLRYTPTLSEHPYLGTVVRQRIADALRLLACPPAQTAVAIIGHSTRRNPESRRATEAQAESIRQMGLAAEVVALYLDDTPAIGDVYHLTGAPNLIAVPYFLANGSHTSIDVPRALGFNAAGREAYINGRRVWYTPPVGVEADLRAAVIELARAAGGEITVPSQHGDAPSAWDCFPKRGLAHLEALISSGTHIIGQLRITPDAVCHVDDTHPDTALTDPAALRRRLRERPFRPLATRRDLPAGWYVPTNGDLARVYAVIETVYPGVLGSASAPVGSFDDLLRRQTGRYRTLRQLDEPARSALVRQTCGRCVRQPVWAAPQPAPLSCPEPCDYWLSTALTAVGDEEGDS